MEDSKISIFDLIDQKKTETNVPNFDFSDGVIETDAEVPNESEDATTDIPIDFTGIDVKPIELAAIHDEYGRMSDIIEALERETGLSVIPLSMGHIAGEVKSLARHKLYQFNGVTYAMSSKVRNNVISRYSERIVKTLSSGIPFTEELNTTVTYDGVDYQTLLLSEDEWTVLLATFRKYKERLYATEDGAMMIEILAERK